METFASWFILEKINIFEVAETKEETVSNPLGFFMCANRFTERGDVVFLYYPPGTRNDLHSHDDRETIYYIAKGEGLVTVGDEKQRLSKGDVVFMPLKTTHQVVNQGKETLIILEVVFRIPK